MAVHPRARAAQYGLKPDWYIDERSDPEKATVAAARYLKTLNRHVQGRLAPRAGVVQRRPRPGAARDEAHASITDFWKLTEKPRALPRETREYVPMILAAIVIARNPAQYGFEIEPEPHGRPRDGDAANPVDLRRIAEWTGTSVDDIQATQPRTAPLDDADPLSGLRAEGAQRHGRPSWKRAWPKPRRRSSPR